jgi:LPXTG-motif cell wall-anchored protein
MNTTRVSDNGLRRRKGATLIAVAASATLFAVAGTASAAIVPTINLATSGNYSVLGGQTVTNTGPSVLNNSVGVSPGTAIVGFPPGIVTPPAIIDANATATAAQAQADLTAAYLDAAGRPLNAETTADLSGLTLVGGVYAGPSKSPLSLTGTLVLDAEGDPNAVFIFQTDSTLITGSTSSVSLINGAQECNVFWQVGSSATLGTGSTFVGNILALTDITVTTGVTVHGRALARNGQTTLDTDVFTSPTCDLVTPVTTTTAVGSATTAPATTAPGATTPSTTPGDTTPGTTPVVTTPVSGTIPRTGSQTQTTLLIAAIALTLGAAATYLARRKTA